ncbi:MAG: class I SAM-dependent methyltransferase, partial [Comamonadaceae bacterium]
MTTLSATAPAPAAAPDFTAIKTRQKAAWASGDYAVVGTTLQIVGETLCEAADLRAGERVLDVAAGNGNATLAAARRWCEVTSTDYVPALLERGRERAAAERLHGIEFRDADAEALPFDDGSFDVVLSTFGCMFAPNPPRVASELLRVCRAGGGTCLPMVLNTWPMKLSGVQLAMPIRPPARQTRSSSDATRGGLGANMQPKVESTTS